MFALTNSQSTPEDLGGPASGRGFSSKWVGFGEYHQIFSCRAWWQLGWQLGSYCFLDPNLQLGVMYGPMGCAEDTGELGFTSGFDFLKIFSDKEI